ncbi:MAG TPA: hypothetical protein VHI13_11340 [Candidatus Kapabacteria bacterium]|nr:hypothetical protein [Candidatus Kapabacteria bacterium]
MHGILMAAREAGYDAIGIIEGEADPVQLLGTSSFQAVVVGRHVSEGERARILEAGRKLAQPPELLEVGELDEVLPRLLDLTARNSA